MHFHFIFFLRLIQESDPLQFLSCFQKHPGRCSFSIEKHMGDGNSGQPSAEGQFPTTADHQEHSVFVVNILVRMPPDFHWNTETTSNPKEPKGTEDEDTT